MPVPNEDPKGDPKGNPEDKKDGKKEGGAEETVESLKAKLEAKDKQIHELNEENKGRRQKEKENASRLERLEKAFKLASGEDPDKADPAKMEAQRTEKRMKTLLVKSAFVSVAAADMHDAEHTFDAIQGELGDLEVDLDAGKVDKKAIKEAVEKLKKERPYLFKSKDQQPPKAKEGEKKDPKGQHEDGAPKDGKNPYQEWRDLWAVDKKKATEFYKKNRDAIIANTPK